MQLRHASPPTPPCRRPGVESREGEDGAWPKQRTLPSLGFPISCPWNITEQSLRGKSLPGWTEPPLTGASPLKSISQERLHPVSSTRCPGSLQSLWSSWWMPGVWVLGPRPVVPHFSVSQNKPHSTPLPPNLGTNTKLTILSSKKFNLSFHSFSGFLPSLPVSSLPLQSSTLNELLTVPRNTSQRTFLFYDTLSYIIVSDFYSPIEKSPKF